MDLLAMAGAAGGQERVRGQNGRGVHGRERERERKVGEVQWEVSGVNEIFSSGGPERIAEIAEAEMINISRGKLPLGCFLHTDSTPSMQTHTHPFLLLPTLLWLPQTLPPPLPWLQLMFPPELGEIPQPLHELCPRDSRVFLVGKAPAAGGKGVKGKHIIYFSWGWESRLSYLVTLDALLTQQEGKKK